jgi:hypothetical protein
MKWLIPLIAILCATNAQAHEFYDKDCCDQRHCHPVPDGTVTENQNFLFVKGYTAVPKISPRVRPSQDTRDHICNSGDMLLCVYRAQRIY